MFIINKNKLQRLQQITVHSSRQSNNLIHMFLNTKFGFSESSKLKKNIQIRYTLLNPKVSFDRRQNLGNTCTTETKRKQHSLIVLLFNFYPDL